MITHLLTHSIVIEQHVWTNVRGQKTIAATHRQARNALIQPMRLTRRISLHDIPSGHQAVTIYFDSDPHVKVDDTIDHQGFKYAVLGRANDQAGNGTVYTVDAMERS